jgi:ribonucleoside-diphosphate reductase alpha chain
MEICKIDKKIISWKVIKNENNNDDRPTSIAYTMAPKRESELLCDIKKVKIQGEQWTIFVGLLDGKPYEVFGGLSKYVEIPNKCKVGKIIKNGKIDGISVYHLIIGEDEDQMIIKDIANVFENKNFGAFTRIISLALRHGIPIQYVSEQLLKDKFSEITSFSKVIARVLKAYIKDGTKSVSEKCTNCKSSDLVYQEGCLMCRSCNYSKCG